MNSSDGFALNRTAEDASPSELSTSDSNANLNNGHQSKGAVPKIRQTKPNSLSKKSVKLNNNEEMLIPKNGTDIAEKVYQLHSDILRFNGYSASTVSRSYLDDYKTAYRSGGGTCEINNSQIDDNDESVDTNSFLEQPQVVVYQPSCSSKDDLNVLLKAETESNCSDETELLSISDDGCIYTYKGDHVADLPSSFFSLEMPLARSPEVPANRQDNASPEMDFLEMDFDPGPSGDADSDSQSNADMENTENLPQDPTFCGMKDACDSKVCDEKPTSAEPAFAHLSIDGHDTPLAIPPLMEPEDGSIVLSIEGDCSSTGNEDNETPETTSSVTEMIKKIPGPWSCSLSNRSTASKYTSRYSRRLHCTLGEFTLPTEKVSSPNDDYPSSISNITPHCSNNKKGTMIWTEEEASKKQITQIGASACGATAVLNVLNALRLPIPPIEKLREAVKTRLRLTGGTLTEYLLSRSVAGSTHLDLINGLSVLSEGQIYARFFHLYPERLVNLNEWLQFWISHGAVPIATLNLQKTHGTVPDAWHHQMIYGVGKREIYFTNPLECVDIGQLWPQLSSESVLLIRKEDVLSRWNVKTDLTELMNVNNERWCSLNVVGQVANMIRQSRKEPRLGFTSTSHIKIPAAYLSGITLAMPKDAPLYPILMFCPELPLLPSKDEAIGYSHSAH